MKTIWWLFVKWNLTAKTLTNNLPTWSHDRTGQGHHAILQVQNQGDQEGIRNGEVQKRRARPQDLRPGKPSANGSDWIHIDESDAVRSCSVKTDTVHVSIFSSSSHSHTILK